MPLHLPAEIGQITLDAEDRPVSYVPFGFVPFAEHQLGNGDTFGLYWPIGQEDQEPLVAETFHDDGALQPMFSSLARFLVATSADTEDEHPTPPSHHEDPASPLAGYQEARRLLEAQHVRAAVTLLESIIQRLPEYTDALGLLTMQYLRLGRTEDACRTAIRAITTPPSFGLAPQKVTHWLVRQASGPADVAADPVWQRRATLIAIPSGGTKQGGAYRPLAEAIDAYLQQGRIVEALTLMQTYAEFMNSETRSFQERHDYDFHAWRLRQRALSEQLPHGPRYLPRRPTS